MIASHDVHGTARLSDSPARGRRLVRVGVGAAVAVGVVMMAAAGAKLLDAERLVGAPLAERLAAIGDRWHDAGRAPARTASPAGRVLPEHLWLGRLDLDGKSAALGVGDTHVVPVAGGGEQELHVIAVRDIDAVALGLEPPSPGRRLVLMTLRAPGAGDGRLIRIVTDVARPASSKPAERTKM